MSKFVEWQKWYFWGIMIIREKKKGVEYGVILHSNY